MVNYWWINADSTRNKPGKIPWSWTTGMGVGEVIQFIAESPTIRKDGKLKLLANMASVKRGDLVICYNTNTEKKIVAKGIITNRMHTILPTGEKVIDVMKLEDLERPISLYTVLEHPVFKKRFTQPRALFATVLKLSQLEYDTLIELIG